ncbi:NlpC/P60 family protein [Woodsholea maritima]|uniref:NlpC/P60 family protein n=1 Tax=Woodsholea maritima TaxID=240237 RepID=UPI00037D5590|nr:NlpC/P60 family protein [Woodsholea maritima]
MSERLRAVIVCEARAWLATPYCHQMSVKGVGCDCLGLVRGVWRHLYGAEPETLAPYSPDWAERSGRETLLGAAERWMIRVPRDEAQPGDVALFRYGAGYPLKHCAILSASGQMLHAYSPVGVVESALIAWWRRRMGAVFRFPDL